MAQISNGNNHLAQPTEPNGIVETRLLARYVGFLAVLTGLIYLRVIAVESSASLRTGQWGQENVLLFGLIAAAILALLCAWRWEAAGGLIAALAALAIAILAFRAHPEQRWFTAFAYSSPFLITGGLFLACHLRRRAA